MKITPPIIKNEEIHELYRYSDRTGYRNILVVLQTYIVIKTTPKGFWHIPDYMTDFIDETEKKNPYLKWTNNYSKKRFCYPTKELAWESYKKRKLYHVERLEEQVRIAKSRLSALQKEQFSSPPENKETVLTSYYWDKFYGADL